MTGGASGFSGFSGSGGVLQEWIVVLVLGPLSIQLSLGGAVVGLSPVGEKDGSEGRVGVVRYLGEPLSVAQVRHNCNRGTLPKKLAERGYEDYPCYVRRTTDGPEHKRKGTSRRLLNYL